MTHVERITKLQMLQVADARRGKVATEKGSTQTAFHHLTSVEHQQRRREEDGDVARGRWWQ